MDRVRRATGRHGGGAAGKARPSRPGFTSCVRLSSLRRAAISTTGESDTMANLDMESCEAVIAEGPRESTEIFADLDSGIGSALSAAAEPRKTVAAIRESLR
ncbi:MAG: hypothetical protein L0Y60_14970 [Beijerinckiaceae bacterium]|nr:hypothetical protein [Beijerinckiaceae bacterium]